MKVFRIGTVVGAVTIVFSANVWAAGAPLQHVFQPNTPARASEVNANFQELADRIANISAFNVYDYRDYALAPGVTQKQFSVSGSGACGAVETVSYERQPDTAGTRIT